MNKIKVLSERYPPEVTHALLQRAGVVISQETVNGWIPSWRTWAARWAASAWLISQNLIQPPNRWNRPWFLP